MRSRHLLLSATLLAVPIAGLGQAAVAASTVPAPHVAVTPGGPSTLKDTLTPLAGDAKTLVYLRQPSLARDDTASTGNPNYFSTGSPDLIERSAAGAEQKFGVLPEDNGFDVSVAKSLYGSTFVATGSDVREDDEFPASNVAHLWNVTSGKSWTVKLSKADSVLAAGPSGFVYSTPQGAVNLRTTAGKVTALAKPFGSTGPVSSIQAIFGTSNSTGVEVSTGQGDSAYIAFAAPHRVTKLADAPGPGAALRCVAASSQAAACYVYTMGEVFEGNPPSDALLLPLNHSAATIATGLGGCGIGVAADTFLATCGHFYSQASGATSPSASSKATGDSMASAYGAGVASGPGDLYAGTTAGNVHKLIATPTSPVSVNAFSLTANRIVYADDQPVASRPGATESLFARSTNLHADHVTLGAPALVKTGSSPFDGSLIAASSTVTVYGSTEPDTGTEVLHVLGPHPTTITTFRYSVQVVGSRVLYIAPPSGPHTYFRIYDASTGQTSDPYDHQGGGGINAALDGHYLVYSLSRGAVYRKNLQTGKVQQLRKNIPDPTLIPLTERVFASGNWVGWVIDYDVATAHQGVVRHQESRLVNANSTSAAINLPHPIQSLTSAGALLTSFDGLNKLSDSTLRSYATSYWLRSYSGSTRQLLPKNYYVAAPQIAGGMIAWAGPTGALEIARLR